MTYRALEAPKASGFKDLPSDLSLLPSRATTYSYRPADIGHSHPVSQLSASWISWGSQPPGQWSPPLHFATTQSTCLTPSLAMSSSIEDFGGMRSFAIPYDTRLTSLRSFPNSSGSYSGTGIKDLKEDTLPPKPQSTGIDPTTTSEVNNSHSHSKIIWVTLI